MQPVAIMEAQVYDVKHFLKPVLTSIVVNDPECVESSQYQQC